jgi:hypothetical protein
MTIGVRQPEGRDALLARGRGAAIYERHHPGQSFVTIGEEMDEINGLLMAHGRPHALAMIKSRYKCDLNTFHDKWDDYWLVSAGKVDAYVEDSIARSLPFVAMLYIVAIDGLIPIELYNHRKGRKLLVGHDIERRTTRDNITGGWKDDDIYLLDLRGQTVFYNDRKEKY